MKKGSYMLNKKNNLVLGLDIGITSVGWGLLDASNMEIIDAGVRLFKEATSDENVKRRGKRGSRRLIRRRKNRKLDLVKLLKQQGIYDGSPINVHPVQLRVKGLSESLTNNELTLVLLHLVKRRGSFLDVVEETKDTDGEGTKVQLQKNSVLLKDKYVCQVQLERLLNNQKYRGIENVFKVDDYKKELEQILSNQTISDDLKKKLIQLIFRKRHYSEGPGSEKSPSQYGRFIFKDGEVVEISLIDKMLGYCSIYPEEIRAPKMSYTAELFNFLNDLNNLTLPDNVKLTTEQKQQIISKLDELPKGATARAKFFKPKDLTKLLNLPDDSIVGFRVDKKNKPLLTEFVGYEAFKKYFIKHNQTGLLVDKELLDDIASILIRFKGIEERKQAFSKLDVELSSDLITDLTNDTQFKGTHSLSLRAMCEMRDDLINTNLNQMQILSQSNRRSFEGTVSQGFEIKLDEAKAILNPVVKRSMREAFKVINALRKEYGEFVSIVIETTREKNSSEQKEKIKKIQEEFEGQKKFAMEKIENFNVKLTSKLIQKIRLYEEQGQHTVYTNQKIDINTLILDPFAYEIDHIIPLSISFDDSFSNKVLVSRNENQLKGQKTPYTLFRDGSIKRSWDEYVNDVKNRYKGFLKRKKLNYLTLEKDADKFDEETMKQFIARNLVDTSYANRVVMNTLQGFFKQNEINTSVHTIRGSVTSAFRKKVEKLDKDRDLDYSHHAIDALLIAALHHQRNIFKVMNSFSVKDGVITSKATGEVLSTETENEYFEDKYIKFIKDITQFNVTNYSWKVDTKPNRQVADETIYSTRKYEGNDYVIKRYKNIYDSKFFTLANDIMNGNIEKYLMYQHDKKTFEKIQSVVQHYYNEYKDAVSDKCKKLITLDKNGLIKFEFNPLFKHKEETGELMTKYSKKNNGPLVTSVQYREDKLGNHIDISGNYTLGDDKKVVLLQISPYRTDFYKNEAGQYKFLTIRRYHVRYNSVNREFYIDPTVYEELKKLKNIDDSFEFLFSMHRDELIELTHRKDGTALYKFTGTANDTKNKIEVKPINRYDNTRNILSIGPVITSIRKLATTPTGKLYEIKHEVLKFTYK